MRHESLHPGCSRLYLRLQPLATGSLGGRPVLRRGLRLLGPPDGLRGPAERTLGRPRVVRA